MRIRKEVFSNRYCIPDQEINRFILDNQIKREDIISVESFPEGISLWYWSE